MPFRLLVLGFVALLLGACTTLPDGPEQAVNLPAQLEALKKVEHWTLRGKMAIRNQQEAVSATLIWKNDEDNFHFRLTNLLGITLADLTVDEQGATLTADGEAYFDTNPARLVEDVTGLPIPLNDLLVWVKGLPRQDDRFKLSDKGLVESLWPACEKCNGWQVNYANFGQQAVSDKTVWLPHSIVMTRAQQPDILIKIRISQWTLRQ